MDKIARVWSFYWMSPRFRSLLLIGLLYFMIAIKMITQSIAIVDKYPGLLISDPIHKLLPMPLDFSNVIFLLTYSAVVVVVADTAMSSPIQFVRILYTIGTMKLLRALSMFLIPLEPPVGIIPLTDPLVSMMTPNHVVALKDLFFSGHTATVILLCMLAVNVKVKRFAYAVAALVPILILWQRVHYTVDVLAGILVAVIVYQIISQLIVIPENSVLMKGTSSPVLAKLKKPKYQESQK